MNTKKKKNDESNVTQRKQKTSEWLCFIIEEKQMVTTGHFLSLEYLLSSCMSFEEWWHVEYITIG